MIVTQVVTMVSALDGETAGEGEPTLPTNTARDDGGGD